MKTRVPHPSFFIALIALLIGLWNAVLGSLWIGGWKQSYGEADLPVFFITACAWLIVASAVLLLMRKDVGRKGVIAGFVILTIFCFWLESSYFVGNVVVGVSVFTVMTILAALFAWPAVYLSKPSVRRYIMNREHGGDHAKDSIPVSHIVVGFVALNVAVVATTHFARVIYRPEPPPPQVFQKDEIEGPTKWRNLALAIQDELKSKTDYYTTDSNLLWDQRKYRYLIEERGKQYYTFDPNAGRPGLNLHHMAVSSLNSGFSISFMLAKSQDWDLIRENFPDDFSDTIHWTEGMMREMLLATNTTYYSFAGPDDQILTVVMCIPDDINKDVGEALLTTWKQMLE